jgi:hypothetical protein
MHMYYARISDALEELVFDQRLTVDEAMNKYFAADYSHRNSGRVRTRSEFAALATAARAEIAHGTVNVLDEFRDGDGDGYGERHVIDITKNDGTSERFEIYIIGRYADDGRFKSLNEAGFPLSGRTETAGTQ